MKGTVTQFIESSPQPQDLVAGLLKFGYTRLQISEMTSLSLEQVNQIMIENNLSEL